jgi:antitoxin component of RelBE/YafQ-DinJ toxin-antitoxin module
MSRTVLQIPMSEDLRNEAEKAALAMGFSSLQESVRLILRKLANRELKVSIHEETLSPEAEARYEKIVKDIEAGKNVTKTKNLDEFFRLLKK